jgi:hypothetical protein
MPLLDHFRPPVAQRKPWESFHARWIAAIADELNRTLPRRFSAEIQIHLGRNVEADVAEFDRGFAPEDVSAKVNGPAAGVATATWAPPTVSAVIPAVFPDSILLEVRDTGDSFRVVAVVELVSPGNKDRPENRQAFAAKCASYLQAGIGLAVIDTVSDKHFNLHNEFVAQMGHAHALMAPDVFLYTASYRPVRRQDVNQIDVWNFPLAVGQPLPTVPLALRATTTIPLDLEATYTEARRNSRLD